MVAHNMSKKKAVNILLADWEIVLKLIIYLLRSKSLVDEMLCQINYIVKDGMSLRTVLNSPSNPTV